MRQDSIISAQKEELNKKLLDAVIEGDAVLCHILIGDGADVNVAGVDDIAAIHHAAFANNIDVCRLLCEYGAELNDLHENVKSPLLVAATLGFTEVCRILCYSGADANKESKCGTFPLHEAARNGYLEICEILRLQGALVNKTDDQGFTPLHWAAMNGHIGICQFLLENGAEVNVQGKDGSTALHFSNSAQISKMICERGADVNRKDKHGNTPLNKWMVSYNIVCYVLCNYGADINTVNNAGVTPLMTAVNFGHKGAISFLVSEGGVIKNPPTFSLERSYALRRQKDRVESSIIDDIKDIIKNYTNKPIISSIQEDQVSNITNVFADIIQGIKDQNIDGKDIGRLEQSLKPYLQKIESRELMTTGKFQHNFREGLKEISGLAYRRMRDLCEAEYAETASSREQSEIEKTEGAEVQSDRVVDMLNNPDEKVISVQKSL